MTPARGPELRRAIPVGSTPGPTFAILFQAGEILFSTLATLHNVQRYLDIMREIRQAIMLGTSRNS